MENNLDTESVKHCYCSTTDLDSNMITCVSCKKSFHPSCMRTGQPSPLAGDIYFIFTCEKCSPTDAEVVERRKLPWTLVIMLALYNLQLQGGGKCGYYRWREHICCFINRNWTVFFNRKKSATWHGTVAGALSGGANRFFISGMEVLGEPGWWSLKSSRLPSMEELDTISAKPRKRQSAACREYTSNFTHHEEKNSVQKTIIKGEEWRRKKIEEEQLLLELQNYPSALKERCDLRRLYRKLKVRQLKRERKVPVFDLDAQVSRTFRGKKTPEYGEEMKMLRKDNGSLKSNAILDRFQIGLNISYQRSHHSSFISKLMGITEEEETSIVSPYTERILKPYIFRDYEIKPLKLQLMEELLARTNRTNPDWIQPVKTSIDYCYIRPGHIPGVNALCNEFFWPGIDMSESLQYPDFTCVALYKKLIIGFAIMVPDVKYNETYITFIFCHPEWRRCGIATFMLYHLIQTCMGKDITLHVSASNTAMLLYQKFGFKTEQLIHDFYDMYLPPESKDSRHALFLRLSR